MPLTFERNSIINEYDSNQPRFENGYFGKAIFIEEGTTNYALNTELNTTANYYVNTMPTDIVQISHSPRSYHTLLLDSNGSVYGWGNNTDGRLGLGPANSYVRKAVRIPNLPKAKYIATGTFHSLVLGVDNKIYVMGRNIDGMLGTGDTTARYYPTQVSIADGVEIIKVAAGRDHSLALTSDGKIYAWGNNYYGQLGLGDTTARSTPTLIISDLVFTDIQCGYKFSVAITDDGSVYSWGCNYDGQLGVGDSTTKETPTKAQFPEGVIITMISIGIAYDYSSGGYCLAIDSNKNAWAWGNGTNYVTGLNSTSDKYIPEQVHGEKNKGTLNNIKYIYAGYRFSTAIDIDGNIYAWGSNEFYGFGKESLASSYSIGYPLKTNILSNINTIICGIGCNFAISNDNRVYGWGISTNSYLGNDESQYSPEQKVPIEINYTNSKKILDVAIDGYRNVIILNEDGDIYGFGKDINPSCEPIKININERIKRIFSGTYCFFALGESGSLYSWGVNYYGQLGTGTAVSSTYDATIRTVLLPSRVIAMSSLCYNSIALCEDGNLYAWGCNPSSYYPISPELGETINEPVLIPRPNDSTIKDVYAGWAYFFVLMHDGTLWGKGNNSLGQLGNGDNTNSTIWVQAQIQDVTTFTANSYHCLAINSEGNVYAWGGNDYGQLGTGNTTPSTIPVQVSGLNGVGSLKARKVYSSIYSSYAIDDNNILYSWGYNNEGQLGNGSTSKSNYPVLPLPIISNNTSNIYVGRNTIISMDIEGRPYIWGNMEYIKVYGGNASSHSPSLLYSLYGNNIYENFVNVKSNSSNKLTLEKTKTDESLSMEYYSIFQKNYITSANNSPITSSATINGRAGMNIVIGLTCNGDFFEQSYVTTGSEQKIHITHTFEDTDSTCTAYIRFGDHESCFDGDILYINDWQTELTSGYTSYTNNSRNDEILKANSDVALAIRGTVQLRFKLNCRTHQDRYIFDSGGNNNIKVYVNQDNKIVLKYHCENGITERVSTDELTCNEWYDIGIVWGRSGANIFLNGTDIIVTDVAPSLTFNEYIYFGCNSQGKLQLNGLIEDLRVSSSNRPYYEFTNFHNNATYMGIDVATSLLCSLNETLQYYENIPDGIGPAFMRRSSGISEDNLSLENEARYWNSNKNKAILIEDAGNNYIINGNAEIEDTEYFISNYYKFNAPFHVVSVKSTRYSVFMLTGHGDVYYLSGNNIISGTGFTSNVPRKLQFPNDEKIVQIECCQHYLYPTVLALSDNGKIYIWGQGGTNNKLLGANITVPTEKVIPVNIKKIYLYLDSAFALDENGDVWSWGNNSSGRLGNGTSTDSSTPVKMTGISNIVNVSPLNSYTVVWNLNGEAYKCSTTVERYPLFDNYQKMLCVSDNSYIALTKDNIVKTWGTSNAGSTGVIGVQNYTQFKVETNPATPLPNIKVKEIHTWGTVCMALTLDGYLYFWGTDSLGIIGNGSNSTVSMTPMQINAPLNKKIISFYFTYITGYTGSGSYIVTDDGCVYTSSKLDSFVVPEHFEYGQYTFVPIGQHDMTERITKMELGNTHGFITTSTGKLLAFGSNRNGELGNGSTSDKVAIHETSFATEFVKISPSFQTYNDNSAYTIALDNEGYIWTWGNNANGQLGDGTTIICTSPKKITVPEVAFVDVLAANRTISVALGNDGYIYAAGLIDGSSVTQFQKDTRVSDIIKICTLQNVGYTNIIVMTSDKKLYKVNIANTATTQELIQDLSAYNIKQIMSFSGIDSFLMLTEEGEIYSWGTNVHGQLGSGDLNAKATPTKVLSPDGTGTISDIDRLCLHSCGYTAYAIDKNGICYSWGDNSNNQCGISSSIETKITIPTAIQTPHKVVDVVHTRTILYNGSSTYTSLILLENGDVYANGYSGYSVLNQPSSGYSLMLQQEYPYSSIRLPATSKSIDIAIDKDEPISFTSSIIMQKGNITLPQDPLKYHGLISINTLDDVNGKTITSHAKIRGAAGISVSMKVYRDGGNEQSNTSTIITNGEIQDLWCVVSFDESDNNGCQSAIYFTDPMNVPEGSFIEIDDWTLEERNGYTSYTDGYRAEEFIAMASEGILYVQQGTFQCSFMLEPLYGRERFIFDGGGPEKMGLQALVNDSGKLTLRYGTGLSTIDKSYDEEILQFNTWYDLALSWSSSGVTMYLNGQKVIESLEVPQIQFNHLVYLGYHKDGNRQLNGFLDDMRFLSRPIDAARIEKESAAGNTLPITNDTRFKAELDGSLDAYLNPRMLTTILVIDTPCNNDIVRGLCIVSGTVDDVVGVTKLEIQIGNATPIKFFPIGDELQEPLTASNFQYIIRTSELENKTYTIKVIATNSAGASTEDAVDILVFNRINADTKKSQYTLRNYRYRGPLESEKQLQYEAERIKDMQVLFNDAMLAAQDVHAINDDFIVIGDPLNEVTISTSSADDPTVISTTTNAPKALSELSSSLNDIEKNIKFIRDKIKGAM